MRMQATSSRASVPAIVASQSLARRRGQPGHASVRSMTHRRGSSLKPYAASERSMHQLPWSVMALCGFVKA